MRKRKIFILMAVILIILFFASFFIGRYPIKPLQLFGILGSKMFPIEPFWAANMENTVFNVRIPRIILACLVGCSLSVAGASYQGIFQNPMAAPDILGASSGAAFGAALAIVLNFPSAMTTVSAFVFSIGTVLLVTFISKHAGGSKILGLVLAGIMVSSLFSAGTSFIKLIADPNNQLPEITYWLMGSLAGAKMKDVLFAAVPMAIGLVPLILFRWRINVVTMGDDEARSIGVNAQKIRFWVIIASTLITAASVSVSGMIGWVGLVIPHLSRKVIGNNYVHLIPATMLIGAGFMLLVDNVSRNLLATEIPLGILTAVIGTPFFIYLITRKEDLM